MGELCVHSRRGGQGNIPTGHPTRTMHSPFAKTGSAIFEAKGLLIKRSRCIFILAQYWMKM